ncbi:MAG: M3 family metallopeptidase [Wenzhouxiangella sp.]
MQSRLLFLLPALFLLSACSEPADTETPALADDSAVEAVAEAELSADLAAVAEAENPLLVDSALPFGMPPFDRIRDAHYAPALEFAMAEQLAQIEAITANEEAPSFENTIAAMERSGATLGNVQRVLFNMLGAHTNDALQNIQREFAPRLAAHSDAILLDRELFARIQAVYEQREALDLSPEALRLVEHYHTRFVRAGAQLDDEQQERLREINGELASLGARFGQNVLAEVNDSAVVFDSREALDGLSESRLSAAAALAAERGLPEGHYVVALLNTTGQPPLSVLHNRDARERILRASLDRGSRGGEFDTTGVVAQVMALRAERSALLGYRHFADYVLEQSTAGSLAAVDQMHADLGRVAMINVRREAEALQALINELEDEPFELAAWDWAYYTEILRQRLFDVDESEVQAFFEMNNVLVNGVFYSAERLFGITFVERPDLPSYHPDTTVWEVFDKDGEGLGILITDFFARPSKRGGAWMNSYRIHSRLLGGHPVVGNHLNVTKPPEGEPALLSWDEVTTMFHEFGHAIHGLFSDVEFPSFAATAVPRDFVEFPAQVYEMWAEWPEVLDNYARHYRTGEPMPPELLERVMEAARFNEGFRTVEYLAGSVIDMAWHTLSAGEVPGADEVMAFEARVLADSGMAFDPVPPRYRTPYFSHSLGGYAAGYYSYIWAEIMDADGANWFAENGGLDPELGQRFRDTVLSSGGSVDPMELYVQMTGREPSIEPLLVRRGLVED